MNRRFLIPAAMGALSACGSSDPIAGEWSATTLVNEDGTFESPFEMTTSTEYYTRTSTMTMDLVTHPDGGAFLLTDRSVTYTYDGETRTYADSDVDAGVWLKKTAGYDLYFDGAMSMDCTVDGGELSCTTDNDEVSLKTTWSKQ